MEKTGKPEITFKDIYEFELHQRKSAIGEVSYGIALKDGARLPRRPPYRISPKTDAIGD